MNTFKLEFKESWFFSKGKIINKYKIKNISNKIKNIFNRILYYLGCQPTYQLQILDEAKPVDNGYQYTTKCISKTIKVFGIKIYKINYDRILDNK